MPAGLRRFPTGAQSSGVTSQYNANEGGERASNCRRKEGDGARVGANHIEDKDFRFPPSGRAQVVRSSGARTGWLDPRPQNLVDQGMSDC